MFDLIEKAKQGDKAALEKIVRSNSGLVWSVVRRFTGRGYDPEDLYQIGSIGLIKAVRRFDLSYNVKFSTYAVPVITGEIKRFLRDDGMIKVSRHYKEITTKAAAVSLRLASEYMREPTMGEIASELGIDIYTLTEAMEACAPCDSIYKTVSEEGKSEMYLLDKLLGEDDAVLADKAALKCALDSLAERERAIIAYRYFMDETQMKVASRLGISQVQVSRIEKKILTRLRENLRDCG